MPVPVLVKVKVIRDSAGAAAEEARVGVRRAVVDREGRVARVGGVAVDDLVACAGAAGRDAGHALAAGAVGITPTSNAPLFAPLPIVSTVAELRLPPLPT